MNSAEYNNFVEQYGRSSITFKINYGATCTGTPHCAERIVRRHDSTLLAMHIIPV